MLYILVFLIIKHLICLRSKTISDHPFRKQDYPWSCFCKIRELWRRPCALISWGPSRLGELRACFLLPPASFLDWWAACLLPPASFPDCLPYLAINITIFFCIFSLLQLSVHKRFYFFRMNIWRKNPWSDPNSESYLFLTEKRIVILLLQDITRSSGATLYLLGRYKHEWYLRKVSPT